MHCLSPTGPSCSEAGRPRCVGKCLDLNQRESATHDGVFGLMVSSDLFGPQIAFLDMLVGEGCCPMNGMIRKLEDELLGVSRIFAHIFPEVRAVRM